MAIEKRERWTEAEVLAFPAGEHDYFDRKAAAFVDSREAMAKAVSAFANSGGGHILIGVRDDGTIEGISRTRGRTATREWLEQVIPSTVSPPLSDFRVHEVEPDLAASQIPSGRAVLVVDIADSRLAPHQAEMQRIYFYREAGHSKPAPHFYIEALRNRLVTPILRADFESVNVTKVESQAGGFLVSGSLSFRVSNDGNVAAYRWDLIVEGLQGSPPVGSGLKVGRNAFPVPPSKDNISLDDTILPGLARLHDRHPIAFFVSTDRTDMTLVQAAVADVFPPDLFLNYRVVSEFTKGDSRSVALRNGVSIDQIARMITR